MVVPVECKRPKQDFSPAYGYLVCPVHYKIGGKGNTKDTMAYIILERTGQIGQVSVLEEEAVLQHSPRFADARGLRGQSTETWTASGRAAASAGS
jgi:hypothetical protein